MRKILTTQDEAPVSKAAADLLKALLLLYGSAWESELKDMLMTIWSFRGLNLDEIGTLQSALAEAESMLSEKGIIKVEARLRGDLSKSEPIREKLYSTDHLYLLMKLLSGDRELDKLRFQLQQ